MGAKDLQGEREQLLAGRDQLLAERDQLQGETLRLQAELGVLVAVHDALVIENSVLARIVAGAQPSNPRKSVKAPRVTDTKNGGASFSAPLLMTFTQVVGILVYRGYVQGETILAAPQDAQDAEYEEVIPRCCTPGEGPSCCPIQWRRKPQPGRQDQFITVAVHAGSDVISFGSR